MMKEISWDRSKKLAVQSLLPQIQQWMDEDDLARNHFYLRSLPTTPVEVELKIKSDLILCGLDYLQATFNELGFEEDFSFLDEIEGVHLRQHEIVKFPFKMPFNVVVTGERLALNLIQHASSIATWTHQYVQLAKPHGIHLLDTRKTTPGLRSLEKYAVRVGGGLNHRLGQTDTWMIKDNHKSCLGGLEGAWNFFLSQGAFYNNIVVEIHSIEELKKALDLGCRHLMLDNFSPADLSLAISLKKHVTGVTFEVSGGIHVHNIQNYLLEGVDAISLGSLTYGAPRVDLSLKYKSSIWE